MSGRRGGRARRSVSNDESPEPEPKRKRASQQPSTSQETADSDDYEPGSWECSVCTYRNRYEAFKCEVCEARKGTSTRKPRLNQSVVIQQQALVHSLAVQQQHTSLLPTYSHGKAGMRTAAPASRRAATTPRRRCPCGRPKRTPKEKKEKERPLVPIPEHLIVRSSAKKRSITVNGFTVTITEFEARKPPAKRTPDPKKREPKKGGGACMIPPAYLFPFCCL
ncbi:RanBP2-type domain-containing protein [Aphelenchoides fujianensis]|nr:RanBP2-type domain-containing protein [Aphelenchoides fujianensis]